VSELELPAVAPEVAPAEALPELSAGERFRLGQREAEEATQMAYLPRVLHPGNAQIPPLVRMPSGASYAVRGHENGTGHVTLIRVDRAPKSKKERRRLRALAKAQRAAEAAAAHSEAGS
jgi:hypothetical protein